MTGATVSQHTTQGKATQFIPGVESMCHYLEERINDSSQRKLIER